MLLWARSSDRRGERTWHIASATLLGSTMLLAASIAPNAFLTLAALAMAYMAVQSVYGPFFSLSSSFLSGPAMASGYALVNSLGNVLGGFGGQYLIGYLRELTADTRLRWRQLQRR
jgi:ACS family tartrate transporter-like MFS transporter